MRTVIKLFVTIVVLYSAIVAQSSNLKIIHDKTEAALKEIAKNAKGVVGIAALDLTDGKSILVNENLQFPQASAIKIPILMEVYKQAAEGKFKLTDKSLINKQNKVGGSGILYAFEENYSELSIKDLAMLMIVLSDNSATNILIDLVGMNSINETLQSLGLKNTYVKRKMLDVAASKRGDENLSNPLDALKIMEILYKGEFVNKELCNQILDVLKIPKSGSINSVLPSSIPVAFKMGEINGVDTEWSIIYLKNRPYILVIMENYELEQEAKKLMKNISEVMYNYYSRIGKSSPYGVYVE